MAIHMQLNAEDFATGTTLGLPRFRASVRHTFNYRRQIPAGDGMSSCLTQIRHLSLLGPVPESLPSTLLIFSGTTNNPPAFHSQGFSTAEVYQ